MAKIKKIVEGIQFPATQDSLCILGSGTLKASKVRQSKKKKKKHCDTFEKEWDQATCSVCMEYPHNAVLLLCSSYDKGCRPYMCATGRRYSNCLEQYKKAYTKVTEVPNTREGNGSIPCASIICGQTNEKIEISELLCPLCRGQVKGWTVVEQARKYLNRKKRTCMQDKCTFLGSYRQICKHVKKEHPSAQPRAVDPLLKEKWKVLEQQRERNDVISTIMSSTPGAVMVGDYVLEPNHRDSFSDYSSEEYSDRDMFRFESFGRNYISQARRMHGNEYDSLRGNDIGSCPSFRSGRISRRVVSTSRSRRQRRNRMF
ncbi:uncharacterized protein LOC115751452 [Rhodamnia argentea]|uniref:Uncharacterized protein LOC115751452 n=1 Tax=Rhodamnia argentea TaxID=178133 RepID=A0A8B8QDN1_9MYRT|nr:uncharacterized protein LOC115751452 [Rhodamnia argentea]XP_048130968.1 uncharacterized protein LOC115751452 [Rhodamnia argentea]